MRLSTTNGAIALAMGLMLTLNAGSASAGKPKTFGPLCKMIPKSMVIPGTLKLTTKACVKKNEDGSAKSSLGKKAWAELKKQAYGTQVLSGEPNYDEFVTTITNAADKVSPEKKHDLVTGAFKGLGKVGTVAVRASFCVLGMVGTLAAMITPTTLRTMCESK